MQAPASAAAGWGVPRLMQLLARHPAGRASFTETKRLALLDAPVVSSGELLYQPPDRLEKHTLQPLAESLLIQGQRLTIVQGGQRREVDLAQYPQALAFVQALRGTLVGNLQLLQSHYQMTLTGSESAWQLKLTPLDEAMLRWVRHVTVQGAHNVVSSVLTQQADGDSSLVAIRPAPPASAASATVAAPAPQALRP